MAIDLPYLASNKNVGVLFEKIASAKVPDAMTQTYLANTIGLKSMADRQLIGILKKLGFLDTSGKPTDKFALLKNKSTAPFALADGIKVAYRPLFEANENAHKLEGDALKGLIAQVAGTDDSQTKFISYTFSSLVKLANFSKAQNQNKEENADESSVDIQEKINNIIPKSSSHGFHFNFQIHLPSNATEETYLNIFNAVRKVFN